MTHQEHEMIKEVLERVTRIEARLSQLMLHMGMDPTVRLYDTPRKLDMGDDNHPDYYRQPRVRRK